MKRVHVQVTVDDLECWITDSHGIAGETCRMLDDAAIFGSDNKTREQGGACCAPRPEAPAARATTKCW